jgi:hypothetical protein
MDNLLGVEDIDIHSLLAVKMQSLIRRFLARCRVIQIVNMRFEKILDPRRKLHYYYDKIADASSWSKPILLRHGDIDKISPTYTEDKAAEIIIDIYRRLRALRRVQRLYAERVEKIYIDSSKKKRMYRIKGSTEHFLQLPAFMENTLHHPFPDESDEETEDDEDSEEEQEREEEDEDEDYDSGMFLRPYIILLIISIRVFFINRC